MQSEGLKRYVMEGRGIEAEKASSHKVNGEVTHLGWKTKQKSKKQRLGMTMRAVATVLERHPSQASTRVAQTSAIGIFDWVAC